MCGAVLSAVYIVFSRQVVALFIDDAEVIAYGGPMLIATILSAAMMLRYSFDLDREAEAVEKAVVRVLKKGYRTIDIMSEGKVQISTREMGDRICSFIE